MNNKLFKQAVTAATVSVPSVDFDPVLFAGDMASIEEAFISIENDGSILTRSESSLEALDNIIQYQEKMVSEEKGFDESGAVMAAIAVESICETLGYPYASDSLPSLEDFQSDSITATTISLEGAKEIFQKAWDAIVKFVMKLIAQTKVLVAKIVKKIMFVETQANSLKEKAKMYDKDGYTAKESEFEAKGMASKFAILLEGNNSKTINKDIVIGGIAMADGGDLSAFSKDMDALIDSVSKDTGDANKDMSAYYDLYKKSMDLLANNSDKVYKTASKYLEKEALADHENSKDLSNAYFLTGYGAKAKMLYMYKEKDGDIGVMKSGVYSVDFDADKINGSVVTLGDVAGVMDEVITASKRVDKNSDASVKVMEKMSKLLGSMGKNADKSDAPTKAAYKKLSSVLTAQASVGSSVIASVVMNNLRANLAAISWVKAGLGEYAK